MPSPWPALLASCTRARLVHKNLRPENILVKTATAEVWLTGFGIASRLRRERQTPERLESLSTLVYIAPEQTGRMNRSIDSRSDLYSYGAILYQMLTGCCPSRFLSPWSGFIAILPGSRRCSRNGSSRSLRWSRESC